MDSYWANLAFFYNCFPVTIKYIGTIRIFDKMVVFYSNNLLTE